MESLLHSSVILDARRLEQPYCALHHSGLHHYLQPRNSSRSHPLHQCCSTSFVIPHVVVPSMFALFALISACILAFVVARCRPKISRCRCPVPRVSSYLIFGRSPPVLSRLITSARTHPTTPRPKIAATHRQATNHTVAAIIAPTRSPKSSTALLKTSLTFRSRNRKTYGQTPSHHISTKCRCVLHFKF